MANSSAPSLRRGITAIAISADGRTVASGGYRRTALESERIAPPLSGHLRPIYSLAFSPQGKTLASGSNIGDQT